MWDGSAVDMPENMKIADELIEKSLAARTLLEIEIGVVGGEEDGVEAKHDAKLYSTPEDALMTVKTLGMGERGRYMVAATFGNVHGVYKPGNVKLSPVILKNSQDFVQKKFNTSARPVSFVFHGGSGSLQSEIREAIDYGVIKMNIDTDMQWAFWEGIKDYYQLKEAYLQSQIGNPEGEDSPNKKYYDPRVWLRKGEDNFVKRLTKAFEDLNCLNVNDKL
jgi:fructose-bisphosphate aldolase class II